MSFTPPDYLRHILAEADFPVTRTRTLTQSEFLGDEVLRRAFVRSLEVIGEASKRLPDDFRKQNPQVD